MRHQGLARVLAVAVHEVEHACGNARFQGQLAQAGGAQRRQLAHFEHGGVAKGQAGRDFPSGGHERHVPRADERAHAHGVKQRVVEVRGRGVGVAVHAGAHFGEVMEVVCRTGDELLASLRDGLAAVVGLGLRDVGHVFGNQVAEFVHQLGAFGRGRVGPFWKRRFGCRDRGVDVVAVARSHVGQHFLGGGVEGLEGGAAADVLAIDEVLDVWHGVVFFGCASVGCVCDVGGV